MTTKVLIVDDEPINVKLIEEILEYGEDFSCKTAVNGEEALTLLETYPADIILLDIMLPGISGYDVCRRIKKDQKHKFAKILMVSGKAMVEERLEGYEAGADDYITKPFIDDELLAKLKVFSKLKKTEEIDELKTSILQLFSHETKTPLNGILLGCQLILDSPSLPQEVIEYSKLIKISGERLHELVRKILLLSSLRNGRKLNLKNKPVLQFLLNLTEQIQHETIDKCSISVNCPVDFTMKGDWNLLKEAFTIVIENAVKHSPAGEAVYIDASSSQEGVFFRVIDQGPGIAPAIQDKVFDEFYSQNIDNHSKGTALSLPIAREIIGLHHGELSTENNAGQGASFLFHLPPAMISS